MKRFLITLFVIILTVSMLLSGAGCKRIEELAAAKASLAEAAATEIKQEATTTPQTTAATAAETIAATPETTAVASEDLDLGVASVKDPDPEMMIESEVLGIVPANQVGIILAEGLTRPDAQKIADELGASIVGEIEFINFYQLETKDTTEASLLASLDKASKIEGVDLAFPNGAVFPKGTVEGSSCSPLNDPLYTEGSNSRPYEMTGVQNAWDIIKASGVKINKVRVGMIDDAVYTESDQGFSPELYFADENGKYTEGKMQIVPLDEENDLTNIPETNPKTGKLIDGGMSHSAMNAHIIGADYTGGGAAGMTSILGENVSLVVTNTMNTPITIPAQNIDPNDITQYQGNTYTLLVNLKKQVENKVKVINLSLGPAKPGASNAARNQAYKRFFEKMSKEHPDVVFVAAAGNEGGGLNGTNYGPGGISLPNVITVGALDQDGDRAKVDDWYKDEVVQKAYQNQLADGSIPKDMTYQAYIDSRAAGSNYATGDGEVTLSACGTGVPVGLDSDGKPVTADGTSFAAPQVTSAIALLQSINPELSAAEIKKILVESAASEVDRDGKKVAVPANMGSGILRVDEAVLRVINDMRKAQDKDAVDLEIEDLINTASIKLTASGGPKEYTITASVSKVGTGGTDIRIETIGEGTLTGSTTQSISAPGKVSWKLTKISDDYFIKVFRSDTGGCALLTLEETTTEETTGELTNQSLAGSYTMTLTNTTTGYVATGEKIPIHPSGSSGGTIGSQPQPYTFSGDTMTWSVVTDSYGTTNTWSIKFTKSGTAITGQGTMVAVYLAGGGFPEETSTFIVTMKKTG